MADYKSIKGVRIQNFTTDPDNPITGQVWYNESVQAMKFQYPTTINAWSTGNDMNTARWTLLGFGTQTAALGAGGETPGGDTVNTELYDGTSWTEVNNLNQARQLVTGTGTQTAGLAIGGAGAGFPSGTGLTEYWNGTSWTEVNDLVNARRQLASAGTQPAALAFG